MKSAFKKNYFEKELSYSIALIIVIFCFHGASSTKWIHKWITPLNDNLSSAGYIISSKTNLMRRTQIDTLWLPTRAGDPIYWGDSLSTSEFPSSLYISKYKLRIDMLPNTLIKLTLNNNLPVIQIQTGDLNLSGNLTFRIEKSQELPKELSSKDKEEEKKSLSSEKSKEDISDKKNEAEVEPDDGLSFPYPENEKLFLLSENYISGAFVNISPVRKCKSDCLLTVTWNSISKSLEFKANENPSFAWELLPSQLGSVQWSLSWTENSKSMTLNGVFQVKLLPNLKSEDKKLDELKNSEIIF